MDHAIAWRRGWAGRRGRRSCPTGGSASSRRSAARCPCGSEAQRRDPLRLHGRRAELLRPRRRRRSCMCARTAARSVRGGPRRCRCRRSSGSSAEGGPAEIIATGSTASPSTGPTTSSSGRTAASTSPTRAPTGRPTPSRHGSSCSTSRQRRPRRELEPPTFPNGIAIEADGSVVWAESYTGHGQALPPDGAASRTSACCPGTSRSPTGSPSPPTAGCS